MNLRRKLGMAALLLLSLWVSKAFASIKPSAGPPPQKMVQFVENKGQWEPQVKYRADIPGGKVYFEGGRLTYLLADLSHLHDDYFHQVGDRDKRDIIIDAHAFHLNFLGSNAAAEVEGSETYPHYHNYFIGNDPAKWAGNVPLHGQLRYEGIYPGIDAVFYGRELSLKYDFVLQAQADPALIQMQYEGLEGIHLAQNGDLIFPTNIGDFRELRPYAYQEINGSTVEVPVAFQLQGNVVSFDFPQGYDPNLPLVIDPTWVFGSYTGSTSDNFGFTATYDNSGNLYGGGIAFGIGYPATPGAFQIVYNGGSGTPFGTGFDMGISKFNPTGTALVWSTFIGGTQNEQPQSLIANANDELVIYGRSFSNNFPTTPGAYQTALAGGCDIVVTKLNAAGSALIGSTYAGGSGNDGLNMNTNFAQNSLYFNYGDDSRGEVMLDGNGDIYIASCTQSNNFPVTAGAPQAAFGGGLQDACIAKFNANLTGIVWATYLGGSGNDAAYSVKVDASNNAFVAGGTESANFPVTAGVFQGTYGGAIDGFITRINPTGTAFAASTYIGTNLYDQIYFLELDVNGEVYVVGQSNGNFAVTPGTYNNPNSHQFIASYASNLTTKNFSTVFGSGSGIIDISPTAFLVDRCGFLYVSGWGGGVNNVVGAPGDVGSMPITSNALFPTTTDSSDFYIIILTPGAAALEYATYYGSPNSDEHVDGGTSRFDRDLVVYQAVCAGCGGDDNFPTTVGAVSQTNNSTNCNMGVFKIEFDAQDIRADFSTQRLESCTPFPVTFTNTSLGGVSFAWDFGDGSPRVNSYNATHTYTVPGTYVTTLTVVDSNSCNVVDTIQRIITVWANPIAAVTGGGTICRGDDIQLFTSGGSIYDWSPGQSLSDSTIANPLASPTINTTYTLIVIDSNNCRDTTTVDVIVTHFDADAGPPASFCEGTGGAQLQAGAINGGLAPYYYIWSCDTTNTFCGLDSLYDDDPIANPSQTTWYYLQVQDSRGCLSDPDSALVEVLPVPIANAGQDQYICQPPAPGAILQGSFSNAPGPFTYYWINGTGLNDSTILTPFARPDTTTIYTLVGISANGCSSNPTTTDTLSTVTVHVHPQPIADAGPDIHSCLGDTVILQGIGYNAGPNYEFEWSPFTGLSDSSITNPLASPPITTTYTLVVWSNGCPSIGDSVTLWVHTLPTPSAGNIREICLGDTAYLDAFAAGDSSASYTYNWWPTAGLDDPTAENPAASPDSSTWYHLIATSSWGCDSPLDSVLVRLKPTPIAEAGPNLQICFGDSIDLQGSYYYTTTDSAPNASQVYFGWTPNVTISDSTVGTATVWPSQSTFFYLSVRHNTCETFDSMLVTVNPELGSWIEADTVNFCQGDSVQLHAGGGQGNAQITWIPGTGLSDSTSFSPLASPSDTTTYFVMIEEGGCTETHEIQLNAIVRPEAAYTNSLAEGCPPHQVFFTDLSEDAIYHIWNFGDGSPVSNTHSPTHTFSAPGQYVVTHTAVGLGNCAEIVSTTTVNIFDTLAVDFSSVPASPATLHLPLSEVNFFDRSLGAAKWMWDFGDGIRSDEVSPSHHFTAEGSYYVTLTAWTANGCRSQVVHGPFVVIAEDLMIPNVFSPNADGINDIFLPLYTGSQPYSLQIFDRWGALHFSGNNKTLGWDGSTANGGAAPDGVYYYVVKVGEKAYEGPVTLVR